MKILRTAGPSQGLQQLTPTLRDARRQMRFREIVDEELRQLSRDGAVSIREVLVEHAAHLVVELVAIGSPTGADDDAHFVRHEVFDVGFVRRSHFCQRTFLRSLVAAAAQ